MARRTFTWNAYESGLTGALSPGITSVTVDSVVGLAAPVYLVIDPDVPTKREWVRVNTINGNTLENLVRNQSGSVGDVLHDSGAKIRAIFAQQHLDDLFLDIQENTAAGTTHIDDGGDPHGAAGYLKQGVADNTYLPLDGTRAMGAVLPMGGFAIEGLALVPVNPSDAVSKDYIDNLPAGFDGLHSSLTDLPLPDAHHTRYANTEAVDAMGPVGNANPYNHARYANSEAVAAMGAVDDANDLNHVKTPAGIPEAPQDGQIYGRRDASWDAAGADYYNKGEIDAMLASYYTLSSDARAIAGRKIFISAGDPGAIANGDIWHDIP